MINIDDNYIHRSEIAAVEKLYECFPQMSFLIHLKGGSKIEIFRATSDENNAITKTALNKARNSLIKAVKEGSNDLTIKVE